MARLAFQLMVSAGPRYLNVIFQGGGIRGIAYAGVLDRLPSNYQIKGVGGTSVGSLVAALIAIGKRPSELFKIINDPTLRKLLEAEEVARLRRLSNAADAIGRVLGAPRGRFPNVSIIREVWNQRGCLDDLRSIWADAGLFKSDKLREWLDKVLENRTFADATAVDDLRIVAANVSQRSFRVYRKADHLGTDIGDAVHASVSIPVFFRPFTRPGKSREVDGGVLSNYPTFLFADSGYPTVGFRLADLPDTQDAQSTSAFLMALLKTMIEAHDKMREPPPDFTEHWITVPSDTTTGKPIASTKFIGLTDEDVTALYQAGKHLSDTLNWEGCSSTKPSRVVAESKPQATLKFSMQQALELLNRHSQPATWPTTLDQVSVVTFTIEADWSVRYETVSTFEVKGAGVIAVTEFASQAPAAATFGQSLVDMRHTVEEIDSSGAATPTQPVVIPAYNEQERRGFAVIHIPPFSAAGARRIRTGFTVPREFVTNVREGKPSDLGAVFPQKAANHTVRITVRVLIDAGLPRLRLTPGAFPATERPTVRRIVNGIEYEVHEWILDEPVPVKMRLICQLGVSRA